MSYFTHRFEGPVERFAVGRGKVLWYTVVFLPAALARELPLDRHPRLRVEAEVAECPVDGAWQPTGDGRHYLMLSRRLLRQLGVAVGDEVEVRFRIDDQDRADPPPELQSALNADPALRAKWAGITPGRRRGLCHHIASARGVDTRQRRLEAVMTALREHEGDLRTLLRRSRPRP